MILCHREFTITTRSQKVGAKKPNRFAGGGRAVRVFLTFILLFPRILWSQPAAESDITSPYPVDIQVIPNMDITGVPPIDTKSPAVVGPRESSNTATKESQTPAQETGFNAFDGGGAAAIQSPLKTESAAETEGKTSPLELTAPDSAAGKPEVTPEGHKPSSDSQGGTLPIKPRAPDSAADTPDVTPESPKPSSDAHGKTSTRKPSAADTAAGKPDVKGKDDKPSSDTDSGQKFGGEVEEEKPKQPASVPVLNTAQQWLQRVETLSKQIRLGEKTAEDADAMYQQLSLALGSKRQELGQALTWAIAPQQNLKPQELADLHSSMTMLHKSRSKLLEVVTVELHDKVTGTGLEGMHELRGEIDYLLLHWRFEALAIPMLLPQLLVQLQEAPLPVVWGALKLFMAILLFRWWRRWAAEGLVRLRMSVLDIRPRTHRNLRIARFIWYIERVRIPLEWMILIFAIFDIIDVPSLEVIEQLCRIVVYWILLARIAVALIYAVATRGVAGLSRDKSGLELRSLRLISGWIMILGMGMDIANTYARAGTILTWVWMLFEILSMPVLILLTIWWRKEIYQRLANLPQQAPQWVEQMLQHPKGIRSFINTVLGAGYLVLLNLRQFLLRQFSQFDTGRQFLANLLGREVAREYERQNADYNGSPISAPLRQALVESKGKIIEKVASKELKRLVEIVEFGHGGAVVVVADLGGGKSTLLERLVDKFDGKAVWLDCSVAGYVELRRGFSEVLGISQEKFTAQEMIRKLRESGTRFIALDNLQRLVRPKMGGQVEFVKLGDLIRSIVSQVSIPWVGTINRAGWQFVRRAREGQIMLEDLVELPSWTQEQLAELVESHSTDLGIYPDFSRINVPHQFDETVYETLEERNRAGFFRILWHASGGNPRVALELWSDALVQTEKGEFVVHLPQQMATSQLENANLSVLLVLRVIIQTELVSAEDIIASLRLSPTIVRNALHVSQLRGWIEEKADLYRINWRWYQTVVRVLTRQNLLTR